jgi:hypothetical protein
MRAPSNGPTGPVALRTSPARGSSDRGGERLALAMSLRARGLRGLDVLRRSSDRAPPGGC